MPSFLIKLTNKKKDYFLEWSTIVDAPITYGLSLHELKGYIKERYGTEGLKDLSSRLERVQEKGHSAFSNRSLKEIIIPNRAGKNERSLSIEGLIRKFCINRLNDSLDTTSKKEGNEKEKVS